MENVDRNKRRRNRSDSRRVGSERAMVTRRDAGESLAGESLARTRDAGRARVMNVELNRPRLETPTLDF